jgi:hypothetical protein
VREGKGKARGRESGSVLGGALPNAIKVSRKSSCT